MLKLVIVLLVPTSFLATIATAGNESMNVRQAKTRKTEGGGNLQQEELRKILRQHEDDGKGDTGFAKLLASLSVTMAQLEMRDINREEEMKRVERKWRETQKEMTQIKNKMKEMEEKTKKEMTQMKNKMTETEKEMKSKDIRIRQLDQKTEPVAPLAAFLTETAATIKNHTIRIEKLEKGLYNLTFGGKEAIPYGAKLINLRPYLGSFYRIYTDPLVWATARAACAERGGQLASMETEEEWQHVFSEIQIKDKDNFHWLGAYKVGGGGIHEGFQWLTGGYVSKNGPWYKTGSLGGKCLLALKVNYLGNSNVNNGWYSNNCQEKLLGLCEFKAKKLFSI